MERRIIIHSLAHAMAALEAALEAGIPIVLDSAKGAALYVGPGWFKAVIDDAKAAFPIVGFDACLDCGDAPGTVLAAFRHGLTHVRFNGDREALERLQDIAAQLGATIETGAPLPALDLLDRPDPVSDCRAYLAGELGG